MTGADIAAIITALGTLIAATGSSAALVIGVLNRRSIREVKESTDGMKDELVKVTGEKNFAEGVKHGENHPIIEQPIKVDIVKLPPELKA